MDKRERARAAAVARNRRDAYRKFLKSAGDLRRRPRGRPRRFQHGRPGGPARAFPVRRFGRREKITK